MTKDEKVLKILEEKGEMSTSELEQEFNRRGEDCPDGAVRTLMRLKTKGLIMGRMDPTKKGWVWSLPEK
jgi:repressor of nif and glnA expression